MVAMALALAYPIAVVAGPWALAGVAAAAAVSACALVLARRPSGPLRAALVAIALWLAAGLGGALLLRGRTLPGFAWVLLVLYAIPLPLIPYLYAKTFDHPEDQVKGQRSKGRGQRSKGKGQRVKGKGTTGVARGRARRLPSLFLLPSSLSPPTSRHGQPQTSTPEPPRDPEGAR